MAALGYLPDPAAFEPDAPARARCGSRGEWYFEPGPRRITPAYVSDLMERASSPRSEYLDDLRRMSLPPQALLIRRMEGLVFSTLGELRARADWAALGREYHAGAAPRRRWASSTPSFWGDAPPAAPRRLALDERASRSRSLSADRLRTVREPLRP